MGGWWHGSRNGSAGGPGDISRDDGSARAVAPEAEIDRFEAGGLGDARDPAALGDRPAIDLLDVAREVDRRRAADVRADRVGIDRRALLPEVRDALRVQATGDHDLHVPVALLVEPGADLLHEVGGDAAALRGRIEADPIEAIAEGVGDAERLFGLVLERVDED